MADYGDSVLTDTTTALTGTITLSKATDTMVTLDTDHKYLDKDIQLTINAQTDNPVLALSDVPSATHQLVSNYLTCSNSVQTNEDGKTIIGIPYGIQVSATMPNIIYRNAVSGWVSKSAGTIALSTYTGPSDTWWDQLRSVVLEAPTSSNEVRQLSIVVPNGTNDTITLTIEVDSEGNSNITDDAPTFANGVSF